MKVIILFGSRSDEPAFAELCTKLKTDPIICSAHRNPEALREIIANTDAELIIAGAGLAAHLPGVIASQTLKPVIGLPIPANFNGLDALLSIIQMPPGIPVLAAGNWKSILPFLTHLEGKQGITFEIHGENCQQAFDKAKETMKQFTYPEGNLKIAFHDFNHAKPQDDAINVLCGHPSGKDAHKLLSITEHGLWVGLNRGENAVLAAIALLERTAHFQPLQDYRDQWKVA
ncbi:MAG: AIR carboxylase family protein [Nanoarchaeota archaeon]